ncbi:hypothetical protein BABINDRAFT_165444 [Babjeviella inositovora NRRL Y-12698]|uniref:DWNN domain-containing protein n=1 Tax=Babjeviella inositovora NRRL Y-12698 TaxID=984486 RepID=A0A1E3QXX2_9ASCO|nr:uncharacterized protein BABINDRAFT_165444 [Babjeviella inositovora NRRL Y-12698]ODQ81932.1 hypothetical protein BABINDRAFT_165444 [Babjeviella inositovora NRRL Y-12698]
MSSTIFYRFKSQKDTLRLFFDGTGITVFDLKKEIIFLNKLGTGADFDLRLYNADTEEEYSDDTQVIPRSTSVVARRSPAIRNGKGSALRYVTGKPRIVRNANVKTAVTTAAITNSASASAMAAAASNGDISEEDKVKLMFQTQADVWKTTQDDMSTKTAVYFKTVPGAVQAAEDAPPPGYMCYRCGSKEHWIKNCPTNDDPNWEGKRIKRTTGIPKSYLKTIEKPASADNPNPGDDDANNYMITEDGKYVVAMADKSTWEAYQKKSQQTKVQHYENLPLELKDPLTGNIFNKPVKTPCCGEVYSLESVENALLDSDFVCPNCSQTEVYLDSLEPAEDIQAKLDEFIKANELSGKRLHDEEGETADQKRAKVGVPALPKMPVMPNGAQFFVPPPFMFQSPTGELWIEFSGRALHTLASHPPHPSTMFYSNLGIKVHSNPSTPITSNQSNYNMASKNIPLSTDEHVDMSQMTFFEKAKFQCMQQPLVPIGTLATFAAVFLAAGNVRTGNRAGAQKWFRYRVIAQAFTLVALVGGGLYYRPLTGDKKEIHDNAIKEKARSRERLWIEELERRDQEEQQRKWRAERVRAIKEKGALKELELMEEAKAGKIELAPRVEVSKAEALMTDDNE